MVSLKGFLQHKSPGTYSSQGRGPRHSAFRFPQGMFLDTNGAESHSIAPQGMKKIQAAPQSTQIYIQDHNPYLYPLKFNIAPEKLPAQLESSPTPHFSGATKKFRGGGGPLIHKDWGPLRTNFTQAFGPPLGFEVLWMDVWLLLAASLFGGYHQKGRDSPPLQNFVTGKFCQKFVEGSPSIFWGEMFLLISLCGLVISNQHLCQKVLETNQLITCQAYQIIPSNSGCSYMCQGPNSLYWG